MEPLAICIKIIIGDDDKEKQAPTMTSEGAKKRLVTSNSEFTDGMDLDSLQSKFKELAKITDIADDVEEDKDKTPMDEEMDPKKVSKRLFE